MAAGETGGRRAATRRVVAAGGVVLRRAGAGFEVVVGHRSDTRVLSLPKGRAEAGETPEETAVREVQEETGLQVGLGRKVGETRYSFRRAGTWHDKTVHFFLMSSAGGDLALHDREFDSVEWMGASEATGRLTYPNEARIVAAAVSVAED
jgi:8-oxo-dGTP pyrophosphatase MutT (NUDIX family)